MSAGERVTDLVGEPVLGVGKGIAKGAVIGALAVAVAIVAAVAFFYLGAPALLTAAFFKATALTIAAAGAIGVGAIVGMGVGGISGLFTGTFKGIKSFFSGRDTQVKQNDQQLQAMREQVETMEQQARMAQMESQMRQMDRARSVETVANPEAPANNTQKLEIRQNAQSAAPQVPAV